MNSSLWYFTPREVLYKNWIGLLVSYFHGWLHVRCHFLGVSPILPLTGHSNELLVTWLSSRRRFSFFYFSFVACASCFILKCTKPNPLKVENNVAEKFFWWIIQRVSFRGVSSVFSPPKVWAETKSYVNNFGKSIGNSQANTATHCVLSVMGQND